MKIHSSILFIALFSIALLAGGTTVRGQSALDGFDPNANDTVRVVVVQPDGKILIGGDFITLSPNGGPLPHCPAEPGRPAGDCLQPKLERLPPKTLKSVRG